MRFATSAATYLKEKVMMKALLSAAVLAISCQVVSAAELGVPTSHQYSQSRVHREARSACLVRRCGPTRCVTVNLCGCPDPFSCRGLYDAYGPYGGRAYLGAYTRYY